LYISASITSTAGSSTLASTPVVPGWNRPGEDRERLIRRHGAIDVERAADHRAGTPTDKNTERAAQERRRRLTAHGRPAG
jgi:pyruvate-formate lyase-activating enzyme